MKPLLPFLLVVVLTGFISVDASHYCSESCDSLSSPEQVKGGCAPKQNCSCVPNASSTASSCICDNSYYEDDGECKSCLANCVEGQFLTDCTPTSNAVCQSCHECDSEEYEITPCTLSQNRECEACTACVEGVNYETQACTSETNRVCSECDSCGGNTFISSLCTVTSNAICQNCDTCEPNEFIQTECDTTLDTDCSPCKICGADEFQESECTVTSNTICTSCNTCDSDEYETVACTLSTNRVCEKCSDCDDNHYVKEACSPTENTECEVCATCDDLEEYASKSCTATSNTVCSSCRTCDNGEFEDSPCTATENRVCEVCKTCEAGEFLETECTMTTDAICTLCSGCNDDSFAAVPCTGSSDVECALCLDCEDDEFETQACTFSTNRNCESCILCEMGKYETKDCTATSNRECDSCRNCVQGTSYEIVSCSASSNRECADCTSNCGEGSYIEQSCSITSDAICLSCPQCEDETFASSGCDGLIRYTCSPCTTCNFAAQYERSPCDALNDRECFQLTICNMTTEFMTKAPSPTSDRECAAATKCQTNEYETMPLTTTTNRQCASLTSCQPGHFEEVAPTPTSDRICEPCPAGTVDEQGDGLGACQACSPGTSVPTGSVGPCSDYMCSPGTADLDSNPETPCQSCNGETNFQDMKGQTICKDVVSCPPGEEENSPPAANSDRICRSCQLSKTFKEFSGQTPCQNTTTCPAGKEETVAPTLTSDRTCTLCPTGKVKESAGQSTDCVNFNVCTKGERETVSPTASTDRICEPCPTDFFKPVPGQTACEEVRVCAQNEYEVRPPTTSQNRVCSTITSCKSGEWEAIAPTLTTDRTCELCNSCPSGHLEIKPCTSTTDRECEGCSSCVEGVSFILEECGVDDTVCGSCRVCSSLEFETESCRLRSNRECDTLTKCTANQFEKIPQTVTSDRICVALKTCDGNQYELTPATLTTDRSCVTLEKCVPGQFQSTAPTSTSNRECQDCPEGETDHDASGINSCRACGPGNYVPPKSSGPCNAFACPAGTADTDEDASTPCEACTVGSTYQPQEGKTSCIPVAICQPGHTESISPTTVRNRACSACPRGTFKESKGSAECEQLQVCSSSEYVSKFPTVSSDRQCSTFSTCDDQIEFQTSAPTSTTDRQCSALKTCESDEFESRAATATTDRACTELKICIANEFEATAPTPTTNRVCQRVKTCDPGFFISKTETATSDRVCTPWRTCTSEEFENQAPSLHNDRVCLPLAECEPGTYASQTPTATTNRVCLSCEQCSDGETYETRSCTSSTNRHCSSCTPCKQGETFETAACSITANRVCSSCSSCQPGFYISQTCTLTSDVRCSQCDSCTTGKYQTQPCGAAFNTQCTDCRSCTASVTYATGGCTASIDTVCSACTKCGDNEFVSKTCTPTTDTGCSTCSVCPAGKHLSRSCTITENTECTRCEEGKFQDVSGASSCRNCSVCQPGQYTFTSCSVASNTVCQECESGTYQEASGQLRCKACTVCPVGKFQAQACTRTSDTVCSDCSENEFQDERGKTSCKSCLSCTSSQFIAELCSPISNTVCSPCTGSCGKGQLVERFCSSNYDLSCKLCPVGEFQVEQSHLDDECTSCSKCTPGKFVSATCSRTSDRVCDNCGPGKFTNSNNMQICSSCGQGQYQDRSGQTSCRQCERGTYSKTSGATSVSECKLCESGKFQNQEGQSVCRLCPSGTAHNGVGARSINDCLECDLGTFQDEQGQATCKACNAGFYNDDKGANNCKACSRGKYSTMKSATANNVCQDCRPGTYQPGTGQSSCIPCSKGRFSTAEGAVFGGVCQTCPKGSYQDQQGSRSCKPCPQGTSGQDAAATELSQCSLCAPGKHQPQIGQIICLNCEPGFVAPESGRSSCKPCSKETFQSNPGETECTPCQECLRGFTDLGGCNRTHDRICRDITPPVIVLRDPMTNEEIKDVYVVQANRDESFVPLLYFASDEAQQGEDIPVSVTGNDAVDIQRPATFTVTYSAVDLAGNEAIVKVTVQVVDFSKPVITFDPNKLVLEAATTPNFMHGVHGYDIVDGDLTAFVIHNGNRIVNMFETGLYFVTYSMNQTDSNGNMARDTVRNVSVVDTTKPVIILNPPVEGTHEAGTEYTDPGYIATDTLDGALTNTDQVTIRGKVDIFGMHQQVFEIIYTVTDRAGNIAVAKRQVTIEDTQPPDISIVGPRSLETEAGRPYHDKGARAVDLRDGDVTVNVENPVEIFPDDIPSTFVVTYSATDLAGNQATATRSVTVRDTLPPNVTLIGLNPFYIEAGFPVSIPGIQAIDLFEQRHLIQITDNRDSVTAFPSSTPRTFLVLYTARDRSENAASIQRTVIVQDTIPPVLALRGSPSVSWEGGMSWNDPGLKYANDSFDGNVLNRLSISVKLTRMGQRKATTCVFSSPNEFAEPPSPVQFHVTPTDIHFVDVFAPANTQYEVTYTVNDRAQNSASESRTITLVDTQRPDVYLFGEIRMYLEFLSEDKVEDVNYAHFLYKRPGAEAHDALDGDLSGGLCITVERYQFDSNVPNAQPQFDETQPWYQLTQRTRLRSISNAVPVGTLYVVDYQVSDGAGNSASIRRHILVRDSLPPVLSISGNQTINIPYGTSIQGQIGEVNAFDLHDGDITNKIYAIGMEDVDVYQSGRYTIQYRVSDQFNNTAEAVRTIDILPRTRPPSAYVVELRFNARDYEVIPDVVSFQVSLSRDVFGGDFVIVLSVLDEADRSARHASRHLLRGTETIVEIGVRHRDSLEWLLSEEIVSVIKSSTAVDGRLGGFRLSRVAAAQAQSTSSDDPTAIIAVVVCVAFVILIVGFIIYRRRRTQSIAGIKHTNGISHNRKSSVLDVDHRARASIGATYNNPLFNKEKSQSDDVIYELDEPTSLPARSAMYSPPLQENTPQLFGFEIFQGVEEPKKRNNYASPVVKIEDSYDKPVLQLDPPNQNAVTEEDYDVPQSFSKKKPSSGLQSRVPASPSQDQETNAFSNIMEASTLDDDDDDAPDLLSFAVTMSEYFGPIRRPEAEEKLANAPTGVYLLRASNSVGGIVLSCKTPSGHCEHHVMELNEQGRIKINSQEITNCVSLSHALSILRSENSYLPYVITKPLLSKTKGAEECSINFVRGTSMLKSQTHENPGNLYKELPRSTLGFGGISQWLHGAISRKEAETKLASAGMQDGIFLVRQKDHSYALSMAFDGRISHHLITKNPQSGWDVNSKQPPEQCPTVVHVIDFLSRQCMETVPGLLTKPLPPDTEA